jgi:hypothetical protein
MSIQISQETEATLIDEAKKLGISVDALLKLIVSKRSNDPVAARLTSELPAWDLGAIGALRRIDIYDDAL